MSFNKMHFQSVLTSLLVSWLTFLSLTGNVVYAQNTSVTIELAAKMEAAQDLKGVLSLLRQMPATTPITERLMLYSRIPTPILDVSKTLEQVQRASSSPQDTPFATEFVYLLGLDIQVDNQGSLFRKSDRKFIREKFLDSMFEWQSIIATDLYLDIGELSKASEESKSSLVERLTELAQALLAALPEEQRQALLSQEKAYKKRNNKSVFELARAERKKFYGLIRAVIWGSAAVGGVATGIMIQDYGFTEGFMRMIPSLYNRPVNPIAAGLALTGDLQWATAYTAKKIIDVSVWAKVHRQNRKAGHHRLLDPFFKPIKTYHWHCALTTKGK